MTQSDFHIETAIWPDDAEAIRGVREQVFIVEQNVPEADEWDGLDPVCRHVLARAADGAPIGTGRLTPQHTLGRMAVLAAWRGQGVGAALLDHLVQQARVLDWAELTMHAQEHAVEFYAAHGFEVFGEPFEECCIRHRHMRMDLTPSSANPERCRIQSRDELAEAMLDLINATQHELCIRSRDLDAGLLDDVRLVEAIQRVASSGRRALVRILVHDTDYARVHGHPLIELAQRLPSSMQLRRPVDRIDRGHPGAMLANDVGDYLTRPAGNRFEADGERGARGRTSTLINAFGAVWERSEPCTELRRLDF